MGITVEQLIAALQRLPTQAMKQEVVAGLRYEGREIDDVRWQGGHVELVTGGRHVR